MNSDLLKVKVDAIVVVDVATELMKQSLNSGRLIGLSQNLLIKDGIFTCQLGRFAE